MLPYIYLDLSKFPPFTWPLKPLPFRFVSFARRLICLTRAAAGMFFFLAFSLLLVPPVFFFLRPLAAPKPSLSSRPIWHHRLRYVRYTLVADLIKKACPIRNKMSEAPNGYEYGKKSMKRAARPTFKDRFHALLLILALSMPALQVLSSDSCLTHYTQPILQPWQTASKGIVTTITLSSSS